MSGPADWKVRDGLLLLRAANAVLAQAQAAGVQPDLDAFGAIVRLSSRLMPPSAIQAECPLFERSIPPELRVEPVHDVVSFRHFLCQELETILDQLRASETAGPAACTQSLAVSVTHAQLFLDRLRASLNMVLDERASGGVH